MTSELLFVKTGRRRCRQSSNRFVDKNAKPGEWTELFRTKGWHLLEPLLSIQASFHQTIQLAKQSPRTWGGGNIKANIWKCSSHNQVQLPSRQRVCHCILPHAIGSVLLKSAFAFRESHFCLSHSIKPNFTHQKLPGRIPRPNPSKTESASGASELQIQRQPVVTA